MRQIHWSDKWCLDCGNEFRATSHGSCPECKGLNWKYDREMSTEDFGEAHLAQRRGVVTNKYEDVQ